jgi:GT2 family glycosyltransferase
MKIGVVIVTYNRRECLLKALKLYEEQSKLPSYILVINNNSTDDTEEILEEWKNNEKDFKKYVVNLKNNVGGSGGFHAGLKRGLELDADWIWVSDDDAYPEKNALQNIYNYIESQNNETINKISSICGQVINNNKTDESHRKRIKIKFLKVDLIPVNKDEYNKESFELELFSYVGSAISKRYLKQVGLPEKDYFIYYDDTEHSYRLSKKGKIICIPSVKVIHDVESRISHEVDWKKYYAIRNRLLFLKKHFNIKYFIYSYIIQRIKCSIKDIIKYKITENIEIKEALNDSRQNVLGLHSKYKPGWKK